MLSNQPTIVYLGLYNTTVKISGARVQVQIWEDTDGTLWAYHEENWYHRSTFDAIHSI